MALWSDTTTEDGALGATGMGGVACFVAAGLTVLGAFLLGQFQTGLLIQQLVLGFAVFEILVYLIAGWRFRRGKGLVWGAGATALLLLELLAKVVELSIGGLIVNIILLIAVVNGIRGAWALRKGIADPETEAEIFS